MKNALESSLPHAGARRLSARSSLFVALLVGGAALSTSVLVSSPAGAVKSMTREAIETLAKPIVHYSYWWGHGVWRMDGKQPGHCSGSCGNCSHWGGLGADCSGFVGKAWQVPSPVAVTTPHHPYNTTSFHGSELHWKHIIKKESKAMDAMVRDSGGSGHIILFKKGNPYGASTVYECAGCSIGCKYNTRGVDASYLGVRRDNVIDFKDADKDGVADEKDNCKKIANKKQTDLDKDGKGDACDDDIDGDKIANDKDNCPLVKNPGQEKSDKDGKGNACDKDDDNDGVPDVDAKGKPKDNCKNVPNKDQKDTDKDGIGDECDEDDDKDKILDNIDNCDLKPNKDQKDTDGDKIGDICDPDDDNDGIPDKTDNCPLKANPNQEDIDDDTTGDVCDTTDDRDNPLAITVESIKSSATPQDPTGLAFDVCIDKELTYAFTLKNAGQASWQPSGDGLNFGTKVSLQSASGAADPITGQNTAPLPKAVNIGESIEITFAGKAPHVPGQYISSWRLYDQKGGPFGQPFQITFFVDACAPPAPQPPIENPTPDPTPDPSDPSVPDPSDPNPNDPDPSDPDPNDPPADETDPGNAAGAGGSKSSGKGGSAGKGGSKATRSNEPGTVDDQGGCQASPNAITSQGGWGLLALAAALPLLRRRRAR